MHGRVFYFSGRRLILGGRCTIPCMTNPGTGASVHFRVAQRVKWDLSGVLGVLNRWQAGARVGSGRLSPRA